MRMLRFGRFLLNPHDVEVEELGKMDPKCGKVHLLVTRRNGEEFSVTHLTMDEMEEYINDALAGKKGRVQG